MNDEISFKLLSSWPKTKKGGINHEERDKS